MNHINYNLISELNMTTFAKQLKILRENRNITQSRLAEILKVSPRAYNRWERSMAFPHFETVLKIADILQVSLDELVGRKEITSEIKIKNFRLRELYQKCDELPDEDQKAVIIVIDSLVKKSNMEKVFNKN